MGFVSWLLGGSDEEVEEEEEEEDDGPDPHDHLDCIFNLEDTRIRKTVKVVYDDGTEEKIRYDRYEVHGGVRRYKKISDSYGTTTYHSHRNQKRNDYGIEYRFEQVKEVVVENVRSFEVIREDEDTYTGTHETTLLRKYYEHHSDRYDVEVDDGDSE